MEGVCQGLFRLIQIWKKVLFKVERLSAGVDYPISLFWKDLIKMYPNAKV